MKTVYPHKQESHADVNPEDIPEFDITTKYDEGDMCRIGEDVWVKTDVSKSFDPNYYRMEDSDGNVYYINRKNGSIISESTYRSRLREPKEDKKDMVNHPPHYNVGGFKVIDIIQAFTQDLNGIAAVDTGNAIKYILRWHNKNGVEDLKKARWYIDHLIKKLEEWEDKE